MPTRLLRSHNRIPVFVLLLITFAGAHSAIAQNENETVGFQSNHIYESGAFGENIDVLNGGLNLTVPIGQRFQVNSRLGYQLSLSYNSKVWDATNWKNNAYALGDRVTTFNESPLGMGFSMHYGRIFVEARYIEACDFTSYYSCWTRSWTWVAPDGSQHEFYHDDGRKVDGVVERPPMPLLNVTQDNSFIRVLGPRDEYCYPASGTGCFRVETPDGLVYSLTKQVDCPIPPDTSVAPLTALQQAEAHSFCGWYTTLIEDPSVGMRIMVTVNATQRIGTPHPIHLKVSYDPRHGFEHAIARTEDSDGRVVAFENCQWEEGRNGAVTDPDNPQADIVAKCKTPPPGGYTESNPANRHAVASYSVNLPSFGANRDLVDSVPPDPPPADPNTLARSEYRFYYELSRVRRADPDNTAACSPFPPGENLTGCSSWSVLRLVRIDYPDVSLSPALPRTYSQYFGYYNQPPQRCSLSGKLCTSDSQCPPTLLATQTWANQTCEVGPSGDFGEVACRTLPVDRVVGNACGYPGSVAQVTRYVYSHDYYGYVATFLSGAKPPKKGGCIPWSMCQGDSSGGVAGGAVPTGVTRGIVFKTLEIPSGTVAGRWTYDRGSTTYFTNPAQVVVTDPVGNDTVYHYHLSQPTDGWGEKPEDGLAPEWRDGLNYRVDYFEGPSTTGRLVRSESQQYDAERYEYDTTQRSKENIRVQNSTTEHMDDGGQASVTNRNDWDRDVGRWRLETVSGFGVAAPKTTKTVWSRGSATVYNPQPLMVEVSDGTQVLSRTDNQYDAQGRLLQSIERRTLPGTIGTEPTLVAYPGDRVTTYAYSAASGNIVGKTLTSGAGTPTYSIRYTWGPTAGICQVAGECGGYLASKAFLDGVTSPWKSIDRSRDGNTGLIFETRDTAEVLTQYEYDRLGRITEILPTAEEATRVDYPSLRETTVTQGDANGSDYVFTRYRYDSLGRLVATQKRSTEATQYACQKKEYDVLGRTTHETEWMWQTPSACTGTVDRATEKGTTFEYTDPASGFTDPFGRVRRVIPAEDDPTAGDKTVVTEYFGTSSRTIVSGIRGASGGPFSATTTYYRDALGRLQAVDAPPGGADAEYTYDAMDRLVTVDLVDDLENPTKHQLRRFGFDGLGQQAWTQHPESGTSVFQNYDPLGNLLQMQDASGNRIRFDYDFAGRLRHKYLTPAGGSEGVSLENIYDEGTSTWSRGKITTRRSENNDVGQVLEERLLYNGPGGRRSEHHHLFAGGAGSFQEQTGFLYNARGQISQISYPSEPGATRSVLTVVYGYSNGLPVTATESGTGTVLGRLSYNAAGGVRRVETPGGGRTEISFDSRNRPTRIQAGQWLNSTWARPTDYDSGAYKYDGAGNIYEIGDNRYGYDGNGRLVSAFTEYDASTSFQESFSYDVFGNMAQRRLTTITNVMTDETELFIHSELAPRPNQVVLRQTTFGTAETAEPVSFVYDANGNLLVGGRRWKPTPTSPVFEDIQRYDYDAQNRVTRVYKSNSPGASVTEVGRYGYDAGGNRISKVEAGNGLTTYYVRDLGGQVLSELRQPSGSTLIPEWASDYVYLGGRLLAMKENLRPEAPRGLRGQSSPYGTGHRITLTWNENSDPDRAKYKVYRKESPASSFSVIAQPTVGASATISVLDPTTYATDQVVYYYVTAVDGISYESTPSTTIKVVAGDTSRPSAPTLQAAAGDAEVTLVWTASADNSDIIGYEIWRGTSPSADVDNIVPLGLVTTVSGLQFVDGAVANGMVYYYRVRAIDAAGNGGYYSCRAGGNPCDESAAPHDLSPPPPPTGLRAASTCGSLGQPETVDLSWEPNPPRGLYGIWYDVYRNSTPTFDGLSPLTRTSATSFRDPASLTPGVTNFYAIRALHTVSPADPDAVVTVSTLSQVASGTPRDSSLTPQVNLFAQATDGSVHLSWQADPLAAPPAFSPSQVLVYRRPNANRACGAYIRVGEMTGSWQADYTDATPTNNMAYDYAISVRYNGRESSLSRPTLAIPLDRPENLFQCRKASSTALQWTPPNGEFYQPLTATPAYGTLGFLKGYHLYHHKRCAGPQGISHQDNSPLRELVVESSDTIDPYLIKPGSVASELEYFDPRYRITSSSQFSPALPSGINANVSYDCNGVVDNVNCVMPKALYKVYAEGTWLSVESDWPSYFHPMETNPNVRCDKWLVNPSDPLPPASPLLPWCSDEPNFSDFVPPPRRVAASASGPGAIAITWEPPEISSGRPPVAGYYLYAQAMTTVGEKTTLRAPVPVALVGPAERQATISGLPADDGPPTINYRVRVAAVDSSGRVSGEAYRCEASGGMCAVAADCAAKVCSESLRDCTGADGGIDQSKCSYGTCTASHLSCSASYTCPAGVCANSVSTQCTPIERTGGQCTFSWTPTSVVTQSSFCDPIPANGHTYVAVIATRGTSSGQVTAISGPSAGGTPATTWQRAEQVYNSNGVTVEIWYSTVIANATNSIVSITLANPVAARAKLFEYSGRLYGTSADLDKKQSTTGAGTTASTGQTPNTSQDSEIWIGALAAAGERTFTGVDPANFVMVYQTGAAAPLDDNTVSLVMLEKIATARDGARVAATIDASTQWAGAIATFKATTKEASQCNGSGCSAQTCQKDTCRSEGCQESIGRWCQNDPTIECQVSSDCPKWMAEAKCNASGVPCDPAGANSCGTGQVCVGGDECSNMDVWVTTSPQAPTSEPAPPAAVRTVLWTVNVSTGPPDNIVPRGRDGIKIAWQPAPPIGTTSTILGFRVYRAPKGSSPFCLLVDGGGSLPDGVTRCVSEVATRAVDDDAYSVDLSTAYSATAGIHYYWDRTVQSGKVYDYRVTQVENNNGTVLETLFSASGMATGMALGYDRDVLPPPQGFRAWAPTNGDLADQQGITLAWCPVPSAADSPGSDLPALKHYNVYRTSWNSGPYRLLARISSVCLAGNVRCEITDANACVTDDGTINGSCTAIGSSGQACGGSGQKRCGVVDVTFSGTGGDCWPTIYNSDDIQDRFTYRYFVTAVSDLGGGGEAESMPSRENQGWLNYCGSMTFNYDGSPQYYLNCTPHTSCPARRDPDGDGEYLVCGHENARLLLGLPENEHLGCEGNLGMRVCATPTAPLQAGYRIIGQPTCTDCGGGGGGGSGPPPNPYNPPAQFNFYHLDHLGSPRVILSSNGARVAVHHYLPFGEERPVQTDPTLNDRAFTGHQRDSETGLDYMLARYYSSSLGRFMAVDPSSESIVLSDPQTWNRYAYAANNPIRYIDPDGTHNEEGHTELTNEALGNGCECSTELVGEVTEANVSQDTWTSIYQTGAAGNNEHGMAGQDSDGSWQSAEEAQAATSAYIDGQIATAAESALNGDISGGRAAMGRATHAAQDTGADSHAGGQRWEGLGAPIDLIRHGRNDAVLTDRERRDGVAATQAVHGATEAAIRSQGAARGLSDSTVSDTIRRFNGQ